MARARRTAYPGAFYHGTCRGNEQGPIFRNDRDRHTFLNRLPVSLAQYQVQYVTSRGALVVGSGKERTTTLVSLEGPARSFTFPSDSVERIFFVLLEPDFLYNTFDLKFYRTQPPLQRTALPASLALLPFIQRPTRHYHAIRIK